MHLGEVVLCIMSSILDTWPGEYDVNVYYNIIMITENSVTQAH